MAATPHAVWLGDQTPVRAEARARETARTAARRGTLPVFALHNVPGRDCSRYSAGGAEGGSAYRARIDAVARGIGDRLHDAKLWIKSRGSPTEPACAGRPVPATPSAASRTPGRDLVPGAGAGTGQVGESGHYEMSGPR